MGYFTKFLEKAYEFINPKYARDKRMASFEELEKSGKLERMCASQVHELFGIRKISNEF